MSRITTEVDAWVRREKYTVNWLVNSMRILRSYFCGKMRSHAGERRSSAGDQYEKWTTFVTNSLVRIGAADYRLLCWCDVNQPQLNNILPTCQFCQPKTVFCQRSPCRELSNANLDFGYSTWVRHVFAGSHGGHRVCREHSSLYRRRAQPKSHPGLEPLRLVNVRATRVKTTSVYTKYFLTIKCCRMTFTQQ
jgi:hypothetical protein